jgi:hypothetical protein
MERAEWDFAEWVGDVGAAPHAAAAMRATMALESAAAAG